MPKPTALSAIDRSQDGDAISPATFSARLREATKRVHREAERTGFIADLIRGHATRAGYGLFLQNLVPVYSALETGLEKHKSSPLLAAFARPELRRLPRLLGDIAAIKASGIAADDELVEAKSYAAAIDRAASNKLHLVAHAYARYLGDLSGGQILKPILARSLGLQENALRFYDFPDVADVTAAKDAMRDALDTVPAESADAAAIIEESIAAFQHNIALSTAVARTLLPAS